MIQDYMRLMNLACFGLAGIVLLASFVGALRQLSLLRQLGTFLHPLTTAEAGYGVLQGTIVSSDSEQSTQSLFAEVKDPKRLSGTTLSRYLVGGTIKLEESEVRVAIPSNIFGRTRESMRLRSRDWSGGYKQIINQGVEVWIAGHVEGNALVPPRSQAQFAVLISTIDPRIWCRRMTRRLVGYLLSLTGFAVITGALAWLWVYVAWLAPLTPGRHSPPVPLVLFLLPILSRKKWPGRLTLRARERRSLIHLDAESSPPVA